MRLTHASGVDEDGSLSARGRIAGHGALRPFLVDAEIFERPSYHV